MSDQTPNPEEVEATSESVEGSAPSDEAPETGPDLEGNPEAAAETTPDDAEDPQDSAISESRAQARKRAQRAERYRLERENRELKERLDALERAQKQTELVPPRLDDFDTDEEFVRAAQEYARKTVEASNSAEPQPTQGNDEPSSMAVQMGMTPSEASDYIADIQAAAERIEDFEVVVAPIGDKITPEIHLALSRQTIADTGDLMYRLAKFPEFLSELNAAKSDYERAAVLNALQRKRLTKADPPKRETSAPPAVDQLSGSAPAASVGTNFKQTRAEQVREQRLAAMRSRR